MESFCPCASEVYRETYIELASCQIVGHGVLQVVDIGYPVIRADIADVQQVEAVKSEPYALDVFQKSGALPAVGQRRQQSVTQADVHALVGRGAEVALVA